MQLWKCRNKTGVCISHGHRLEIVGLASVLNISSLQVSILVLMYVLVQWNMGPHEQDHSNTEARRVCNNWSPVYFISLFQSTIQSIVLPPLWIRHFATSFRHRRLFIVPHDKPTRQDKGEWWNTFKINMKSHRIQPKHGIVNNSARDFTHIVRTILNICQQHV